MKFIEINKYTMGRIEAESIDAAAETVAARYRELSSFKRGWSTKIVTRDDRRIVQIFNSKGTQQNWGSCIKPNETMPHEQSNS